MISSEVQRTLVKSPPELWAEISDPEALARHLGEFGEIRITRVHPEQKVEWEAPEASGSIVIKPSGWGTKVKLTVTRELSETGSAAEPDRTSEPAQESAIGPAPEAEGAAAPKLEPDPEEESEPHDELGAAEAQVPADERLAEERLEEAEGPIAASLPLDAHGDESGDEPPPESAGGIESQAQSEPEPQRARRVGFFARLFGRRRGVRAATDEPDLYSPEIAEDEDEHSDSAPVADQAGATDEALTLAAEVAIFETELDAEPAPTPATPPTPLPIATATPAASATEAVDLPEPDSAVERHSPSDAQADIAAELERAEEAAEEQVTAVLTGVLDRLGSAHHRPFSRA
jgi:hypothetical protein